MKLITSKSILNRSANAVALKIVTNTTLLLSLLSSHKTINFASRFTMPSTCPLLPFFEQWTDCNRNKYEYDISLDTTRRLNFQFPAISTNNNTTDVQTSVYIFLQKYSVASWSATARKLKHSSYQAIYHVSQTLEEGGKKSKNMTVFHTVSFFHTHTHTNSGSLSTTAYRISEPGSK
jgi:hypothetical protein